MRIFIRSIMSCVTLVTANAFATTWYVDGSNVSGTEDGTSWPTAFAGIQDGLDAATNDDTIIVEEGTYVENINFGGKDVVLQSTDPLDAAVVAATVIEGNLSGTVVTFSGLESAACALRGFTIAGGRPPAYGIGGIAGNGTLATVEQNHFVSNKGGTNNSRRFGAAIHDVDGLIANNTITGNAGNDNGYTNAACVQYCDGIIRDNVISDNETLA